MKATVVPQKTSATDSESRDDHVDLGVFTFVTLPAPTYRAMDAEAKKRGLPLAVLLSQALDEFLKKKV